MSIKKLNHPIKNCMSMLVIVDNRISFYTTAEKLRNQVGNDMKFNAACREVMQRLDRERARDRMDGEQSETIAIGYPADCWHINIAIDSKWES